MVVFVGIQLGNMLRFVGSLSLVILIPMRSSGLGFQLKDPRPRRPINPLSSGGKIIVLLFSGIVALNCLIMISVSCCFDVDYHATQLR